ncbi:hypothetical protein ACOME3_005093 [Neoechinorhynchus agilis]
MTTASFKKKTRTLRRSILNLLAGICGKSINKDIPTPTRKPTPIFRTLHDHFCLLTWNFQSLTSAKIRNPGVLSVITNIIIQTNTAILACQEVASPEPVRLLVNELNQRHGQKWNLIVSTDASGRMFRSNEHLAFIYREPMKLRSADVLIVNVHLKSQGLSQSDCSRNSTEIDYIGLLIEAIDDDHHYKRRRATTIVCGDFNRSSDQPIFRESLESRGFSPATNEPTNISLKNPRGSCNLDNVWFRMSDYPVKPSVKVIRERLTHPMIPPNEWDASEGLVSDHCPDMERTGINVGVQTDQEYDTSVMDRAEAEKTTRERLEVRLNDRSICGLHDTNSNLATVQSLEQQLASLTASFDRLSTRTESKVRDLVRRCHWLEARANLAASTGESGRDSSTVVVSSSDHHDDQYRVLCSELGYARSRLRAETSNVKRCTNRIAQLEEEVLLLKSVESEYDRILGQNQQLATELRNCEEKAQAFERATTKAIDTLRLGSFLTNDSSRNE